MTKKNLLHQTIGLVMAALLLVGCGSRQVKPSTTTRAMEEYEAGEPVSIPIADTVHVCEYELPYAIIQVTETENRPVMLEHSCLGIDGRGVDRYCEDGEITTVFVGECSDAVFCKDERVEETFTWDQQEFVEITEACGGETIRREIEQQVPEGKYEVMLRIMENDQVVNRLLKEFMISVGAPDPAEPGTTTVEEAVLRHLERSVTAPYRTDQIEVVEEKGGAATARVVTHFRTSAAPGWTTMEATVECEKGAEGWLCDEHSAFHSSPQAVTIQFEYPGERGILDYEGSYMFKVNPIEGAEEYRWVFTQNGVEVWDSVRDDRQPAGHEYGIHPGTEAHDKFVPGGVEVWVRASINSQWTHAGIVTITLR